MYLKTQKELMIGNHKMLVAAALSFERECAYLTLKLKF